MPRKLAGMPSPLYCVYHFRRAAVEDAVSVAALFHETFPLTAGEIPDEDREWLSGQTVEYFAEYLQGAKIEAWVAETDTGEVVGFSVAALDTGRLARLYTHPATWGGGLADRLHDLAVDALRCHGWLSAGLECRSGNVRAQKFYTRRGWVLDSPLEWSGHLWVLDLER